MNATAIPAGAALRTLRGAGAAALAVGALFGGLGWLYILRGLGWFALGPQASDALPLLQLAGFDRQPLLRLAVAWLPAGVLAGVALIRVPRWPRTGIALALALVLLPLASQASFALARNLKLSEVLFDHGPGFGPWLEAVMYAAGCALQGAGWRRKARAGSDQPSGSALRSIALAGDLRLGRGEHRDAPEHQHDRQQVHAHETGAGS